MCPLDVISSNDFYIEPCPSRHQNTLNKNPLPNG